MPDSGWFVTAHATALTVSKLLMGASSDRLQPRMLLIRPLLALGISSIALSFATTKNELFAVIVTSAALQGAAWPVAVGYLQRWFSPGPIGVWFSLMSATTTVGGIMLAFSAAFYWRAVAFNFGWMSVVIAIVARLILDDGEKEKEGGEKDEKINSAPPLLPLLGWICSRTVVWQVGLLYALAMMTRTIAETWLPLFTLDPSTLQYYFEIGGLLGSLGSGFLVDALTRRGMTAETATRQLTIVATSAMLVVASSLVLAIADTSSLPSSLQLSILSFLSGCLVYSTINLVCLATAEMSAPGDDIGGTLTALVSFMSQFGSIMAGTPVAVLLQLFGRAALAPLLSSALVVCGAVAYSNRPFVLPRFQPITVAEKKKQ